MKPFNGVVGLVSASLLLGVSVVGLAGMAQPPAGDKPATKETRPAGAEKKEFSVQGWFVECCTCRAPCPCELTGDVPSGCQGVGAYTFEKAEYDDKDCSGAKAFYALHAGNWVRIYIDCPDAGKRAAAEELLRAALAGFGKIESVRDAKIEMTNKGGRCTVTVDGGKVCEFTTEPVLGGDGKTPISHANTHNVLNPVFLQGKCVSCTFHDGDRSFSVDKGRNAYFHDKMKSSGKI